MLSRTPMVVCPWCRCHARAGETACPHCGAALRGADAPSGLASTALVGLVALGVSAGIPTSCGGKVVVDTKSSGGEGGAGASNSSTQDGVGASTNTTVTSSAVVTTTTTTTTASNTTSNAMAISSYGPAPTCDDPFDDPPECALCLESHCCYELGWCVDGECTPLAKCSDEECLDACAGP